MNCKLPPEGWKCLREAGHEGPCAAVSGETDPVFQQGFEEAKKRIIKALGHVETTFTETPQPFAYEPPKTFDRRPSDVLTECIDIVKTMKCPHTKG